MLEFDREKSGRLLADSLAALAARLGKPATDAEVEPIARSLVIRDEAERVFDLETGWPSRFVHERRIRLQDRARVDRPTFERRP